MSRWDSEQHGELFMVEGLPEIVFGDEPRTFKVIFNPKKLRNCHNVALIVQDSAGEHLPLVVTRWGTKMSATVTPRSDTSEGVCVVAALMGDGPVVVGRFWYVR
jgi:hypothetical protein